MSDDEPKSRPLGLGLKFGQVSAINSLPVENGLTFDHLLHAQRYTRALILEGLSAAEVFDKEKEYSVILLNHENQMIGGKAKNIYAKAAGNLTLEELTLANFSGTLSDFLKVMDYRIDTPVSYVVLDTRQHVLLSRDSEGSLFVEQKNSDFRPMFH